MKLLPPRRTLCVHHTTMHRFTVSLTSKPHIHKVHVCLAATRHMHCWQNDWDVLRVTAVTRGWNGYRNKSQHRKLTLEKKILPLFLPGLEPETFRSTSSAALPRWRRNSGKYASVTPLHWPVRNSSSTAHSRTPCGRPPGPRIWPDGEAYGDLAAVRTENGDLAAVRTENGDLAAVRTENGDLAAQRITGTWQP